MFEDPETMCRKTLAPYAAVLASLPRRAWSQYRGLADEDRIPIDQLPIQRANVVFAYMLAHARELLAPMEGVVTIPSSHSEHFLLEDRVLVRLKALNEDSLSRNYPTPRQLRFNANLSLPGLPAQALRVDVGYRLDPLGQAIEAVEVVRRQRSRVQWKFSLDEVPAAIVLPIQRSLDEQLAPLPAVRARRDQRAVSESPPRKQATNDD